MRELILYNSKFEKETLQWFQECDDFFYSLVSSETRFHKESLNSLQENLEELKKWTTHPNELYIILEELVPVGFVCMEYPSKMVAKIETIFVDEAYRGKGIGTFAILEIENIIKKIPSYEAMTLMVSLRNPEALKLYHKLGYIDLSMIVIRKEFGKSKRNKPVNLLGMEMKY